MKNKFTARLSVFMCLVLLISCFAACSVKPDNTGSSTLLPDDSWQSGTGYDKVVIGQVELVDLVKEALGDETPEDFKGDLSTLTPEQLEKVEDLAEDKNLIVEKDDKGDTVIKKEEIPTTQASKDEIDKIFDKASVKDPSNLTPEEVSRIEDVADKEGMVVQTKPNGEGVVIVKPVTTTKKLTTAPKTTERVLQTEKDKSPSTTSVYKPVTNKVTSPMGTSPIKVSAISASWKSNYNSTSHSVFVDNEATPDGGSVCVGITLAEMDDGTGKMINDSTGLIVKYDKNGKQQWSAIHQADATTSYEDVTVLEDGSIIAVGYTLGSNAAPPHEYAVPGTVEAIMVKYSAKGNLEWTKILGGSDGDMLYAVAATSDGGFVVGGKSISVDGDFADLSPYAIKAFVFKCTADGNVTWRSALSGTAHSAVESLAVSSSGDIFATISVVARDGDYASICDVAGRKTVIAKFTSTGKRSWAKGLYESGVVNMHASTATDDGGVVIAGFYTTSSKGNIYSFKDLYNGGMPGTFDGIMIKYDANGNTVWTSTIVGFESDYITGITKINGGYAVTGYSASSNRDFAGVQKGDYDAFIYTVSNHGKLGAYHNIGGSSADNARAICTNGNTIFVCGSTNSSDVDFAQVSPAPNADNAAAINLAYNIG